MKKKIISLCLVVALVATAIAGATLAYFTDTDYAKNVMVTGNVSIVQNETDRNGKVFEQNQDLFPAVYLDAEGNPVAYDELAGGPAVDNKTEFTAGKLYGDDVIKNAIDKVITVTNDGSEAAYVRTYVLVPNIEDKNTDYTIMHYLYNGNTEAVKLWAVKGNVEVEGAKGTYSVWQFTYQEPLAANATSEPSLLQFWLDPKTTKEEVAKYGDALNIYAFSQAVQAEGFDSADEALEAAFGEFTPENLAAWLVEASK